MGYDVQHRQDCVVQQGRLLPGKADWGNYLGERHGGRHRPQDGGPDEVRVPNRSGQNEPGGDSGRNGGDGKRGPVPGRSGGLQNWRRYQYVVTFRSAGICKSLIAYIDNNAEIN